MSKPVVYYVDGIVPLITCLGRVEDIPAKAVNKAAAKGANVVRKAVRGTVPVDTGMLKKGIVRNGERRKVKGKRVYDITMDRGMNDIFQKPIKKPGQFGGKSDHGYYPASMEYGFLTRSKGRGLSFVPGYHFMRAAAEEMSSSAKKQMIDVLNAEIEKDWNKK